MMNWSLWFLFMFVGIAGYILLATLDPFCGFGAFSAILGIFLARELRYNNELEVKK